GTIDDAAGEEFDKVANLLGLPYPGGPSLSRAAATRDPTKYRFPRPLLDDPSRLDFSFSGLKTAVRYLVAGTGKVTTLPTLEPQQVADVAASFEAAVADCLVGKAELALEKCGYRTLCVGGGVAANRVLCDRLEQSSLVHNYRLY